MIPTLKNLKYLSMTDAKKVISMKPLTEVSKLNTLRAHPYIKDFLLLENHPSLEFISVDGDLRNKEQFWSYFKRKYRKNLK